MPMAYAEYPERQTIELTVTGALSRADYDAVLPPMAGFIQQCGTIGVIEIIDSFSGFADQIVNEDAPPAGGPMAQIRRVALVSDIGWFCPILSSAPSTLGIRIKSFKRDELEEARRWVLQRAD